MNNQSILLILGAAIGSYYLMNKDREGFRFADELPAGNAFTAPPSFPQPAALRAVPQYESISQMSGDNMLLNKQTLTSDQVNTMLARVGKTTPELQDVKDIIMRLKNHNIGILITDHNVRETLDVVDRAYIIAEGRVLTEGDPAHIINHPDVRRVYLGENFSL